jgi:hypothetical protein
MPDGERDERAALRAGPPADLPVTAHAVSVLVTAARRAGAIGRHRLLFGRRRGRWQRVAGLGRSPLANDGPRLDGRIQPPHERAARDFG